MPQSATAGLKPPVVSTNDARASSDGVSSSTDTDNRTTGKTRSTAPALSGKFQGFASRLWSCLVFWVEFEIIF